MTIQEVINEKIRIEAKILEAVAREVSAFHTNAGLSIESIDVEIGQFQTADGKRFSIPTSVECRIGILDI